MGADKEKDLKAVVARRLEFFRKKPEAALYRPKVASRHVKGLYTETTAREHLVKADYGEAAGGSNKAPNPIELLLAAFAACIESAFYEFAAHEGLRITSVTAEVEGTLDLRGLFMIDDVAAGFKGLTYTLDIESPDDGEKVSIAATGNGDAGAIEVKSKD
ncbi:MAG: OsmC family protein, partial [Nitrospiraceae bacterium]|nr:OsmC family protein [Nitrospiraceae bacterium]